MAETDGSQALLACRCLGAEQSEYQGIAFKSFSDSYVFIVYAFMYALGNGY
jgi:hypothetical protein